MPAHVVHLGDLHLGPGERNADRRAALDAAIAHGAALTDLAAWLLPGDLNHAKMTIDDRNWLAERLMRMGEAAPVVVVRGNHDVEGDLDIFGSLDCRHGIHVVTDQPRILWLESHGAHPDLAVCCLPYPTEAGLAAAGVGPREIVPTARELLDQILLLLADELAAYHRKGLLTLVVGHANIRGALASTGQPQIGQEIELDAAMLARFAPASPYIGFNHIHKHQAIGGAVYAGSLCRLDAGEVEPKGFVVASFDEQTLAPTWAFVPLEVPPLYHVEGTIAGATFTYTVTRGPEGERVEPPLSWRGCDVRARVRFPSSEKQLLDRVRPEILANFAECRRLQLELVAVPDRALRAPAVASAQTLAEKVAAWAEATGTLLPADLTARLQALQTQDAEALLAALDARADALVMADPADEEAVAC